MPQEYFKQLVKKILLGKMPSRQENGQCLVHQSVVLQINLNVWIANILSLSPIC